MHSICSEKELYFKSTLCYKEDSSKHIGHI